MQNRIIEILFGRSPIQVLEVAASVVIACMAKVDIDPIDFSLGDCSP